MVLESYLTLVNQANVQLKNIVSTTTGISLSTLAKWKPPPISTGTNPGYTANYRHSPNPYLTKYGPVD